MKIPVANYFYNPMKLKPTATLLGLSLISLPAPAATLFYTAGHLDGPAIGYVSATEAAGDPMLTQGFEPHLHNEGGATGAVINGVTQTTESEYEPGDVVLVVPDTSTIAFNSVNYYWLPQDETDASNQGVGFLGVGSEELDPADWTGGTITLTLTGFTGPGNITIWQDDSFGGATIFFDSAGDSITIPAGGHTHFNWGFAALGDYELEFTVSGNHMDDGLQTASATYLFQAVPEPSSILLGGLGMVALLGRRSRASATNNTRI